MRVKSKLFIFCLLFITSAASYAYAGNVSLRDVFTFPKEFSAKEIQIEGEVIGEALENPRGVWLNVSTGPEQIGVFSPDRNIADQITYWGSYDQTGDQVRVTGIFYKECLEHQISDLHLSDLEVIREGYKNVYLISPQKHQLAKILAAICLAIALICLLKLKYGKRD